ncbi:MULTISPECIES: metallophosphoesterase [unclassified Micromonospora]|uniref:metallophosphoesterase n=1 Tax=unclassified Micromonospora TaxID=2617518 RepID=UPI003639D631
MPASPLFVHLSDIHFDAGDESLYGPNAMAAGRLVEDLERCRDRLGQPNAILVTGDIAFSGKSEQYDQARHFLEQVTQALDIEPHSVLTVPGNHDVDRNQIGPTGKLVHDQLRGLDPTDSDKLLNSLLRDPANPLLKPLAAYNDFAMSYECSVSAEKPSWEAPFDLGDELRLRVFGLTSVLVCNADDARAGMIMGSRQTSLNGLQPQDVGMVLAHHPPDWWHDRDMCLPLMRRMVSVCLYGHKHEDAAELHNDETVNIFAGAVNPEREHEWNPHYNWIQLSVIDESAAPRLRVRHWPRRYVKSRNKFKSDTNDGGWAADEFLLTLPRYRRPRIDRLDAGNEVATGRSLEPRNGRITLPASGEVSGESPHQDVRVPAVAAGEESADVGRTTGADHTDSLSERPPLVQSDGAPSDLRRAAYSFTLLEYGAQTRVLANLDLLTDSDRELLPQEQFIRAFERAHERGITQQLVTAVTKELDERELGEATMRRTRGEG